EPTRLAGPSRIASQMSTCSPPQPVLETEHQRSSGMRLDVWKIPPLLAKARPASEPCQQLPATPFDTFRRIVQKFEGRRHDLSRLSRDRFVLHVVTDLGDANRRQRAIHRRGFER